jgi:hypothetical protein
MTNQEWDAFYHNIMPLASVLIGVMGLGVGVWGLYSRGPQVTDLGRLAPPTNGRFLSTSTPKVHYEDGQVLVSVRNPGDWQDIRDFITPLDPNVRHIYNKVGPDTWLLLDWVCRNVSYRSDNGEWWGFPGETLWRRDSDGKLYADCEDSSILLASLLANFTDGYCAIGAYRGYGHAWCQSDSQILETTFTYARPVPDPQNYRVYALFNDREVIEMWPGALTQLYQLARNENGKRNLMLAASRGII